MRGCPGCRERSPQPGTSHQAPGNRRVGPCNQKVDADVVEALEPGERFAAEPGTVKDCTGSVAERERDAEDNQANGLDPLVARDPSIA